MENDQLICHLLQVMLEAILLGKPYPGQKGGTPFFPDIEMVKDLKEIVVSDRYLDEPCKIEVPGYRFLVLSEAEIVERANLEGDFPYFSLTEAETGQDVATISLQLSWAASEASKQAGRLYLSGGGVRVRFEIVDGEWLAPSGPIATWMA